VEQWKSLIATATLKIQTYGMQRYNGGPTVGRPSGIWLECTTCPRSEVIVGSARSEWEKVPTKFCAEVFKKHGWTGKGSKMTKAKCPECSERKGVI
jgi:hypothetical protein